MNPPAPLAGDRLRRVAMALLAVVLGWGGAGAAYGLFVSVRMGLADRAVDNLLLMLWVGLFFAALGSGLLGLRGAIRLALRWRGGRAAPAARSVAAGVAASLGGFGLAWTVLLCAGDLVVSMGFQPGSSLGWFFARCGLALATAAGLCWLLAGPICCRMDGWLRRFHDPSGVRSAAVATAALLATALGIPLVAPQPISPVTRTVAAATSPRVDPTGLRLLLIGLDGATWDVVGPLIEAGELPELGALAARGAVGTPLSPPPRASPITWTTIVTGQPPAIHGVQEYLLVSLSGVRLFPFEALAHDPSVLPFSFVALAYFPTGLAEGIPPTSDRVRAPSLWHVLSAAGLRSVVLGMPCTWPARPIEGLVVSDRFGPNEFDMFSHHAGPPPERFWPPQAEAELLAQVVDSGGDPAPMLRRLTDFDEAQIAELAAWSHNPLVTSPMKLLAEVHDADETFLNILQQELAAGPVELGVVLVNGLDLAMHAFWSQRFPREFGQAQATRPGWGRLIDAFHVWFDGRLGRLLAAVGPETIVFVVSDSGMQASPGNPVWSGWHAERALFLAAGGPIRPGTRIEKLDFQDIAPTALYLLGLPVAGDLPGRVLVEMIEPDFLTRHPPRRTGSNEADPDASLTSNRTW